jgi:MFS-type transporter involved in bile tolerance (Atg22 family)
MAGLRDVFIMKERMNNGASSIMIILEKASILITLLMILAIGIALDLPSWGVGLLFGLSVGPVVFGHY